MRIQIDTTIEAAISDVFDHLVEPDKQKLWNTDLKSTEILGGSQDNPVGMRFKQTLKNGKSYQGEVMAYVKPHELRVRLVGSGSEMDIRYQLIQIKGQTRMSYCADIVLSSGLARTMALILTPLSKHLVKKRIGALKRLVEKTT